MKIPGTYRLLLTATEEDHNHNYQNYDSYSDVYKAEYLQGKTLDEDHLGDLKRVAARRDVDERGGGWKDANSCWIYRDGQRYLSRPGAKLELDEKAPYPGLQSSSGRFLWTVQHPDGDKGPALLRQLDRGTGESTTVTESNKPARFELASHPTHDQLVWTVCSPSAPAELHQWEPEKRVDETLPTLFKSYLTQLTFSPNGEQLALLHDNELFNYDLKKHCSVQVSDLEDEEDFLMGNPYRSRPEWSPDGKRLFYTNTCLSLNENQVSEYSNLMVALPNGSERRLLLEEPAVWSVDVGPPINSKQGSSPA